MAGNVSFVWNDAPLRVAALEAMAGASQLVRSEAVRLCRWAHVRSTIGVAGAERAYVLGAASRDARFLEHGTSAHTEAPRKGKALKLAGGGFARGRIPHPATAAHPFLGPAAATLPAAYIEAARSVFPKG